MITLKDKVPAGEWLAIDNELYREYVFPDFTVRVENPVKVMIRMKPEGHSHRIIAQNPATKEFTSWYIPAGWRAIRWQGIGDSEAFSW